MSNADVTLALVNANALTMEQGKPRAEAVAIASDRIAAVGRNTDILRLACHRTHVIDCKGLTLLPGFNDAHLHLAGLVRRLQDLDCSPIQAPSIPSLQEIASRRAATLAAGAWVRGFGYDDLQMAEKRHPDRHDLDIAVPDRPAWLEHQSGHAAVLNSLGLQMAGIHRETPDPPGGFIDRDPSTGDPTGIVYEMHGFLRQRLGNTRGAQDFEKGMRAVDELLRGYGITSVQDAGADNGIERWRLFRRLQLEGVLSCAITMFAGVERLAEFHEFGLRFGSGTPRLRLGHAKIMLAFTSGLIHPTPPNLEQAIAIAHDRGFPVAIHCIEEVAIIAAANALSTCAHPGLVDRIEHCAEGTPAAIEAVQQAGITVVTQPGFVYHRGRGYRENVEPRILPHLYPAGKLLSAGIPTALSSDAPIIDPNPWPSVYSAVTSRAADGLTLSPGDYGDGMDVEDAIMMYTLGGAEAEGTAAEKGSITPGKLADLVLVDRDPTAIDPKQIPEVGTRMTISGGAVAWKTN